MKKKLAIILGILVVIVALIDVFFLLKFRQSEDSGIAPTFITPLRQETVIQQQLKALNEVKSALAGETVVGQTESSGFVSKKATAPILSPQEKEEIIIKQLQLLEKARRER